MHLNNTSHSDHAIEKQSTDILDAMLTKNVLWMTKETYTESSLRSNQPTIQLSLQDIECTEKYLVSSSDSETLEIIDIDTDTEPTVHRTWLIKSDLELMNDAIALGLTHHTLEVSMSYYRDKEKSASDYARRKIARDLSFGFYRKRQNT